MFCVIKKITTAFSFLLLISLSASSQQTYDINGLRDLTNYWEINGTIGANAFLGDLGGNIGIGRNLLKDYMLKTNKLLWGLSGTYNVNNYFALNFGFNITKVVGVDSFIHNTGNMERWRWYRNLSFRSKLQEAYATFTFYPIMIITKTTLNVKFFLVFALLIILYEGGKMLALPSLLIILVFGLLMNNWHLVRVRRILNFFPKEKVEETTRLLHSLTAESSFLIRTFFFIMFGFSIDVKLIASQEVILIGSVIVLILFIARFLYLRFFLKESVYPEVVFIPRGLVTVLLFYKIPSTFQLKNFNYGILFFVILVSSLIMMFGMIFYKKKKDEIVEEELLTN